jgi:uncharacterized protein YuzE
MIVTGSLFVEPDADSTRSVAFRKADGTDILTVDSTNKRVGIGDATPDGVLDIFAPSDAGVPALFVQHNDADVVAVDIDSSNTTAHTIDIDAINQTTGNTIDITGNSYTTGGALNITDNSSSTSSRNTVSITQVEVLAKNATALRVQSNGNGDSSNPDDGAAMVIDKNNTQTTSGQAKGIFVDIDQTGEVASSNTMTVTGIHTSIETNAASDGIVNAIGLDIDITGDTDGTSGHTGISVSVGQADTNTHIEMLSSADPDDKCTISVGLAGETRIETVDDAGANAHLKLEADGKLILTGSQVLILSGGSPASFDESSAADVNFFVSGAKGAHGGSTKGTAVFGGDTYTSGSAYVNTLFVENEDPTIVFREPSTVTDKGTIGINSSDNILIENKSTNKHIVFKVNDGGVVREGFRIDGGVAEVVVNQGAESLVDFRVESANKDHAIFVDGSTDKVLILSGGAPSSPSESLYADVNFFVSGAIGSAETALRGTSVFGGDVVTSGSYRTKGAVRRATRLKSSNFSVKPTDHFLFFNTSAGHVTASLESAATAGSGRILVFKDVKGYADNNYIVIKPNGSDTIEGINDETKIKVASGSLSLVCDGSSRYFVFGERD